MNITIKQPNSITISNADESVTIDAFESLNLFKKLAQEFTRVSKEGTTLPVSVSVREKIFYIDIAKHFSFWSDVTSGKWEPETFEIFDHFINKQTIYFDVGAWIGPTLFYAGQLASHAHGFEPDPTAFRQLEENLRLNINEPWASNISINNFGVSDKDGMIQFENPKFEGDSQSTALVSSSSKKTWSARVTSLASYLESHVPEDVELFLKIDIEGGEYMLFPKVAQIFRKRPASILISFHPDILGCYLQSKYGDCFLGNYIIKFHFVRVHWIILSRNPFKFIYVKKGRRISKLREMIKLLVLGDFSRELVFTNQTWE
jgi:FkbM family methyltransferase